MKYLLLTLQTNIFEHRARLKSLKIARLRAGSGGALAGTAAAQPAAILPWAIRGAILCEAAGWWPVSGSSQAVDHFGASGVKVRQVIKSRCLDWPVLGTA